MVIALVILDLVMLGLRTMEQALAILLHALCSDLGHLVRTLRDVYSMVSKLFGHGENRNAEVPTRQAPTAPTCATRETADHHTELSRREVETVMARLGIFGNQRGDDGGDEARERIGVREIAALFEEEGPSLEEVQEAFYVFDGNCDGYIDARELADVLHKLGLEQLREVDCRSLIQAFDDDGNGLIDFREFKRLVEKSFSQ